SGSLTPSASPAGTFYTLGQIFNPLASTSYDSSSVAADADGSILQIVRYINDQLGWASASNNVYSLSNNVGIGDTTPEANFEVSGTASISQLYLGGSLVSSFGVSSDSLDFDEFVDAMTLDADTTIASGGFGLVIGTAAPDALMSLGRSVGPQGSAGATSAREPILAIAKRYTTGAGKVPLYVQSIWDSPSATSGIAGIEANAQIASTSAVNMTGSITSIIGRSEQIGTGTATEMTGVLGVGGVRSAGTIYRAQGVTGSTTLATGGTILRGAGLKSFATTLSGTMTDSFGIWAASPSFFGGTITNLVGVAIDGMNRGTNNISILIASTSALTVPSGNYAIYSSAEHNSFFAGNIGIGVTAPQAKLEISGTASASFFAASAGSIGSVSYGFGSGFTDMGLFRSGTTLVAQNRDVTPDATGRSRISLGEEFFNLNAVRSEDATHSATLQCFDEGGSSMICGFDVIDGGGTGSVDFRSTRAEFGTNVSVSGNFELTGTVASNLTPRTDNTFSLGTSALRWANLFAVNASVSSNLEVSGVASISQLFVNGVQVTGGAGVTSDSLDFDEFVDSMTLDADTSIASGGFVLNFNTPMTFGPAANNFNVHFYEDSGYSVFALGGTVSYGETLGIIDASERASNGYGFWSAYTLPVNRDHIVFALSPTPGALNGSDAVRLLDITVNGTTLSTGTGNTRTGIRLNGPTSNPGSAVTTFTGIDINNLFDKSIVAASPAEFNTRVSVSSNFEVGGTASVSGVLYANGGCVGCGGGVGSDSLDFDEFEDSLVLDANLTVASAGFTVNWEPYFISHLLPNADDTYDLGDSTHRWRDIYAGPGTLRLGASGDEGCFRYNTTSNELEFSDDCSTYSAFTADTAGGWTDDGTHVRLTTSSDNVGIGTTTSLAKLTVKGGASDILMNVSDSSAARALVIQANRSIVFGGGIAAADTFHQFNTDATNENPNRTEISALDDLFISGDLEIDGIIDISGDASISGDIEMSTNGTLFILPSLFGTADIDTPTLTFNNDRDTGIAHEGSNAPNKLFFVTAGNASVMIDGSGNLVLDENLVFGSTGAAKLDVEGNAGANLIVNFASSSGARAFLIGPNRAMVAGGGAYAAADDFHQFNTDSGNNNPNRSEIGGLDDLFISGDLELDGIIDIAGDASVSGDIEMQTNATYLILPSLVSSAEIDTPLMTFNNDRDTGIAHEGTNAPNKLFFVTAGNASVMIDGSGNLVLDENMVFSTAGAAKLDVEGNAGANLIVNFASSSAARAFLIGPNRAVTIGGAAYNAADDFNQINDDATNNNPGRAEIDSITDLFIADDVEIDGILDVGGAASISGQLEVGTTFNRETLKVKGNNGTNVSTANITFVDDPDTGFANLSQNGGPDKIFVVNGGSANAVFDDDGDLLLRDGLAWNTSDGDAKLHVISAGSENIFIAASTSASTFTLTKYGVFVLGDATFNANLETFNQFNDETTNTNPGRSEITDEEDLFIAGDLEIDGILDIGGFASISGDLEVGTSNEFFVDVSANNVGINTSAPTATLHVSNLTASQDIVNIYDNTTEVFSILDGGNVGVNVTDPVARFAVSNGAGAQDIFNLFDNTTEVMTVLNGGNVGIGATGPEMLLEVGGNILASNSGNIYIGTGLFQVSGVTAAAYNRFGTGTTGHALSGQSDVLVSDDLEVDGVLFADGGATMGGTLNLNSNNITNGGTITGTTITGTSFSGGSFSGSSLSVSGGVSGAGASFSGNIEVAGIAKLSAGSAGAPSYTFTSQTNTGMFRSGTSVGISAAGTQIGLFSTAGLTVTGTIEASGGFIDNGNAGIDTDCAANEFLGNQTTSGGIVTAGSCETDDVDYAERFYAGESGIAPGDVIVADPRGAVDIGVPGADYNQAVVRSTTAYQGSTIGIISTMPGLIIGAKGTAEHPTVEVALAGRVPVKVNDQNGPVSVGDMLTSSDEPGIAMRANRAGMVVGTALTEPYASGSQQYVIAFVNPQFWMPTVGETDDLFPTAEEAGLFERFVGYLRELLDITLEKGLIATIKGVFTEVVTERLCLEDVCITKDELRGLLDSGGIVPVDGSGGQPSDEPEDEQDGSADGGASGGDTSDGQDEGEEVTETVDDAGTDDDENTADDSGNQSADETSETEGGDAGEGASADTAEDSSAGETGDSGTEAGPDSGSSSSGESGDTE
ncbi:MAG TPA: hypothetical protein VD862_04360, partial [Candidatus Paceibacterota bacterium]|nr:hypothetical protein [Candidatus Paceibacterota bacterium]